MTTTELMIGNWVLDTRTNNPLQVNPFMSELEVPEWKEIELTGDILIKNKFTRIYCTQCFTYCDYYGHCIIVDLDNLKLLIRHDYKILYNVTFNQSIPVHFLQNAIKMTGVNKKIVL